MASPAFTTYILYYFMQKNAKHQSDVVFLFKAAIAVTIIALCLAIAVKFPYLSFAALAIFLVLMLASTAEVD
jgi:hypothetical protein